MSKVAPITERKDDHIRINLERDVRSALTTGLEKVHFVHEALPELDLEEVDTRLTVFGKPLQAPILVSSMTGGTRDAARSTCVWLKQPGLWPSDGSWQSTSSPRTPRTSRFFPRAPRCP